jgi:uncharacterized protein YdaU (DUF1376 family)
MEYITGTGMALKTKTKKKSPQDATLRNVTALKKRVEALERQVLTLYQLEAKRWGESFEALAKKGK